MNFQVFASLIDQKYQRGVIDSKHDDLFTSLEHLQVLIETNNEITKYFKEIITYQYRKLEEATE